MPHLHSNKSFLRWAAPLLGILLVLGIAFSVWLKQIYTVPIMMYHHVNYSRSTEMDHVSPENFEKHMRFLKTHHYQVIGLDELVKTIQAGRPLPRKSVVISFDDGYQDNYQYAFKILKKYQFPAVLFVLTERLEKKGYLTWNELKEMAGQGIIIGSHSRNHDYLPELSFGKQKKEIKESKRILEEGLGITVEYFSYPLGGFSDTIKFMVRKAGYKASCTTNRGYDRFNKDLYELKRVRFSDKDNSNIILWFKLSGYYNFSRELKNPY